MKNLKYEKRSKLVKSIIFLINLFVLNGIYANSSTKTVVLIDNMLKEFDSNNIICSIDLWANKISNSCKCCLAKHFTELKNGKNPKEILDMCRKPNKVECDDNVIKELEKNNHLEDFKTEDEKLKKLIELLYQKTIIVKEVYPHDIKFDSQGNFTELALSEFLAQAYKDNKLANSDFESVKCTKVQNLMGGGRHITGTQTKQLFKIISSCNKAGESREYILKEMKLGIHEIKKLENSVIIEDIRPYIYPKKVSNFPSFIFPIAYISYVYNNKPHYLSLLDRSPGVLLSTLISQYKENKIKDEEVKEIYFNVGFALSNFHKEMMKHFKDKANPNILLNPTYVQADAHQANVFYDKANKQTIFIDNENIKLNAGKDPFYDITWFFFVTLSLFIPNDIMQDKGFLNKWTILTMESFFQGYINAYEKGLREKLALEIFEKLRKSAGYSTYYYSYNDNKDVVESIIKILKAKYGLK